MHTSAAPKNLIFPSQSVGENQSAHTRIPAHGFLIPFWNAGRVSKRINSSRAPDDDPKLTDL